MNDDKDKNRYYTPEDEELLRFYQMPKTLFGNLRYKGLSIGAKAVYSILRDRQDLSKKNNWIDEEGYIYLIFSEEELSDLLEMTAKTARKYKKELVNFDLIVDKRVGQGKANRIYVLKPEMLPDQNGKKYRSKKVKITVQEGKNLPPNDTEVSDPKRKRQQPAAPGGCDTKSYGNDKKLTLEQACLLLDTFIPGHDVEENQVNVLLKRAEYNLVWFNNAIKKCTELDPESIEDWLAVLMNAIKNKMKPTNGNPLKRKNKNISDSREINQKTDKYKDIYMG